MIYGVLLPNSNWSASDTLSVTFEADQQESACRLASLAAKRCLVNTYKKSQAAAQALPGDY